MPYWNGIMDRGQPTRAQGRKSVKTNHEEKANPSREKLPADTEDILKRLDAIEQAVETLDERLSKLEGRFIPYPGHVAARGKNRS